VYSYLFSSLGEVYGISESEGGHFSFLFVAKSERLHEFKKILLKQSLKYYTLDITLPHLPSKTVNIAVALHT
jgi:hypothetical protein